MGVGIPVTRHEQLSEELDREVSTLGRRDDRAEIWWKI